MSGHSRRPRGVVLADDGRDILGHEIALGAQEASNDRLERRGDGGHPSGQRRGCSGHVGIEVVLVLVVDGIAGDGGFGCLPAVDRVEFGGVGAGCGGQESVCVVEEFGVGRVGLGVREGGGE